MEGQRPGNMNGALPLQPYSSFHSTNIIGALPLLLAGSGCEAIDYGIKPAPRFQRYSLRNSIKKVCPALRRADTSKQNEKPTFILPDGFVGLILGY